MKVAIFTVRATVDQSARWKIAAEADGHRSVATWLPEATDSFLRMRARLGRPLPLVWHRGRFRVTMTDGSSPELPGLVSQPFGVFRGDLTGPKPGGCRTYTLMYLVAGGRPVATLHYAKECRILASELVSAFLRQDLELAAGIVARHERERT